MTGKDWGWGEATLHKMTGKAPPPEVTFELSPTQWSPLAMQRPAGEHVTWRIHKSKSRVQRAFVLGTERRAEWLGDKWKRGTCLQWSQEVDQAQMAQGFVGHSVVFVLYCRCRGKTLEGFKQGSVMFSCLYRWLSSPLWYVANEEQLEGDQLCTWGAV